jgi:hypothetical protein
MVSEDFVNFFEKENAKVHIGDILMLKNPFIKSSCDAPESFIICIIFLLFAKKKRLNTLCH